MTEAAVPGFNLIDALKYGAIGISFVCLLLAFWSNQTLLKKAGGLQKQVLDALVAHSRWTMKFSFVCLLAAIAIEGVDHFSLPVTVKFKIVPSTLDLDVKQIRSPIPMPLPMHVEVSTLNGDVPLDNGVPVAPGSTVIIYVDQLWNAVKQLDSIVYGQQQRTTNTAGIVEPKQ